MILSKVNNNEGRYIAGYTCDGCGRSIYTSLKDCNWIEGSSTNKHYCPMCQTECKSCGLIMPEGRELCYDCELALGKGEERDE